MECFRGLMGEGMLLYTGGMLSTAWTLLLMGMDIVDASFMEVVNGASSSERSGRELLSVSALTKAGVLTILGME